jgi:hypothetical protein
MNDELEVLWAESAAKGEGTVQMAARVIDQYADWLARKTGMPRQFIAEALATVATRWVLEHGATDARTAWLRDQLGDQPPAPPPLRAN